MYPVPPCLGSDTIKTVVSTVDKLRMVKKNYDQRPNYNKMQPQSLNQNWTLLMYLFFLMAGCFAFAFGCSFFIMPVLFTTNWSFNIGSNLESTWFKKSQETEMNEREYSMKKNPHPDQGHPSPKYKARNLNNTFTSAAGEEKDCKRGKWRTESQGMKDKLENGPSLGSTLQDDYWKTFTDENSELKVRFT